MSEQKEVQEQPKKEDQAQAAQKHGNRQGRRRSDIRYSGKPPSPSLIQAPSSSPIRAPRGFSYSSQDYRQEPLGRRNSNTSPQSSLQGRGLTDEDIPEESKWKVAKELAVFPARITLEGIVGGTTEEFYLRVRNISSYRQRVRAKVGEQTKPVNERTVSRHSYSPVTLTLEKPLSTSLAPGLDSTMKVVLKVDETSFKEGINEMVAIECEGERVEIPVVIHPPRAIVEFDDFLDFGPVAVSRQISRNIRFTNVGTKDASVWLSWDKGSPAEADPKHFYLPCQKGQNWRDITISLFTDKCEMVRCLIEVTVDNGAPKLLDVAAEVVKPQLLLQTSAGIQIEDLKFGDCYFGQKLEKTLVLFNHSPLARTFRVFFTRKETDSGINPFDIYPLQGTVGPYEEFRCNASCKPLIGKQMARKHFEESYVATLCIEDISSADRVQCEFKAGAHTSGLKVSEDVLEFPECSVGSHKDMLITATNMDEQLSLSWTIKSPAGFVVEPTHQYLGPLDSCRIRVSFRPAHLGVSQGKLRFVPKETAYFTTSIPVYGKSNSVSLQNTQRLRSRIKDLPPEMIEDEPQWTNNLSSDRVTSAERAATLALPARHGDPRLRDTLVKSQSSKYRGGTLLSEMSGSADYAALEDLLRNNHCLTEEEKEEWEMKLTKTARKPRPWYVDCEPEEFKDWDYLPETKAPYTYPVRELERRSQQKEKYDDFLVKSRIRRSRSKQKNKKSVHVEEFDDPKQGLAEPPLMVPHARERLWLAKPLMEDGTPPSVAIATAKPRHNPNKLISRKFKSYPSTQPEIRDCQKELTSQEISQLLIGPCELEFGRVYLGSRNVLNFAVTNTLREAIFAKIELGDENRRGAGRMDAFPISQVIPSGSTAGFDIVVEGKMEGDFVHSIPYTINAYTAGRIAASGRVYPVELKPEPKRLVFQFPDDSAEWSLSRSLQVYNPTSAKVNFTWKLNNPETFRIAPNEDSIDAGDSMKFTITYNPNPSQVSKDVAKALVNGCEQPACKVDLLAEIEDTDIRTADSTVDCGTVNVGQASSTTTLIRNEGIHVACFKVSSSSPSVTVSPCNGHISPSSELELQVTLQSKSPIDCAKENVNLELDVRGKERISIPVRGCVVTPRLRLLPRSGVRFGEVLVGARAEQEIQICNDGALNTIVFIDLSHVTSFGLGTPVTPPEEEPSVGDLSQDSLKSVTSLVSSSSHSVVSGAYEFLKVDINSSKTVKIPLIFQPLAAGKHSFSFPVRISTKSGTSHSEGRPLKCTVSASAVPARLQLDTSIVDFGQKVIARERERRAPFSTSMKVFNSDRSALFWEMACEEEQGDDQVFSTKPTSGSLDPLSSEEIEVTFYPQDIGTFRATFDVYLEGALTAKRAIADAQTLANRHGVPPAEQNEFVSKYLSDNGLDSAWLKSVPQPYIQIHMKGTAIEPQISFNTSTVVLPKVPIGFMAWRSFEIINMGFDLLQLRYEIEKSKQSIVRLVFPEGDTLSLAKERLPVIAVVDSSRTLSTEIAVTFVDDIRHKYTIRLVTTVDNCLLTNLPFLEAHKAQLSLEKRPPRPPRLQYKPDSDLANLVNLIRNKSSVNLLQDLPAVENLDSMNNQRKRFIISFLNSVMLKSPIQNFPRDVIQQHGRPLWDALETFSGKVMYDRISGKVAAGGAERVNALKKQIQSGLSLLHSLGALLHDCRPEFFFSYNDYYTWHMEFAVLESSDEILSESEYDRISAKQWMHLVLQMIRVLVLPRVGKLVPDAITKSDENSQGEAKTLQSSGKKKGHSRQAQSNFLSDYEWKLLQWLSHHYCKDQGKQNFFITDFAKDIADGTVLAAVLRDHLPRRYAEKLALKHINFQPVSSEDSSRNVENLIKALQEVHISPPFTLEDFQELSGSDGDLVCSPMAATDDDLSPLGRGDQLKGLLICLWMQLNVPRVVSRNTVKFGCPLGQTAVKTIDVFNSSKSPVTYNLMLDGPEEFSVASQKIVVDAGSKYTLSVYCTPTFSKTLNGRLTLMVPHSTALSHSMLVFDLVGEITSRPPISVYQISTPCYKPKVVEMEITNVFESTASFNVSLVHMSSEAKSGSNFVDSLNKGEPSTFWTTVKHVDAKPHSSRIIPVQFLPLHLGTYKAAIVLDDPQCGELVYEIVGESVLPSPLESLQNTCPTPNEQHADLSLWIPIKNIMCNEGYEKVMERTSDPSARAEVQKQWKNSRKQITWQCEVDSPYFEVPNAFHRNQDVDSEEEKASAQLFMKPAGKSSTWLPLKLKTTKPGTYNCQLLLHGEKDIRVYSIKISVIATEVQRELQFECGVGESVSQNLPIENPTDSAWMLSSRVQVLSSKLSSAEDALPESVNEIKRRHATENQHLQRELESPAGSISHSFIVDSETQVGANSIKSVVVKYAPQWIGLERAKLVLHGGPQEIEIQLSGKSEEVVRPETIKVKCNAFDNKQMDVRVENPNPNSQFKIPWITINCARTEELLKVSKKTTHITCPVSFFPKRSGKYSGELYVYDAFSCRYRFVPIELNVAPASPTETFELETNALSSETMNICLSHEEEEDITFTVGTEGDFLYCPESVLVPAHRQVTLPVHFVPLLTGRWPGAVTLQNEKVGEIWYEFWLKSKRPQPMELPSFDVPIGDTRKHSFVFTNPSPHEHKFSVKVEEGIQKNFMVQPKSLSLPPNGEAKFTVSYRPSDIDALDEGQVTISSRNLAPMKYHVKGKGLPPHSKEETVEVNCESGSSTSGTVEFWNPFAISKQVQIQIQDVNNPGLDEVGRPFELLRSAKASVEPFGTLQIPFAFAPGSIGRFTCKISVSVGEYGELRVYHVNGIGEAPVSETVVTVKGKARQIDRIERPVKLLGLSQLEPDDHFDVELYAHTEDEGIWLNQVLSVGAVDSFVQDQEVFVKIAGSFAPLKPKKCYAQLAVSKAKGGTWRFPLRLIANPADPDDEIRLEALLNETNTVRFVLENQFPYSAPFSAQLDLNSAPEFSVSPSRGTLPPKGSGGVEFSVSYSSREYGRVCRGTLVIDTADMQWRYSLIGTAPEYVRPEGHSQLETRRKRPPVGTKK